MSFLILLESLENKEQQQAVKQQEPIIEQTRVKLTEEHLELLNHKWLYGPIWSEEHRRWIG